MRVADSMGVGLLPCLWLVGLCGCGFASSSS